MNKLERLQALLTDVAFIADSLGAHAAVTLHARKLSPELLGEPRSEPMLVCHGHTHSVHYTVQIAEVNGGVPVLLFVSREADEDDLRILPHQRVSPRCSVKAAEECAT